MDYLERRAKGAAAEDVIGDGVKWPFGGLHIRWSAVDAALRVDVSSMLKRDCEWVSTGIDLAADCRTALEVRRVEQILILVVNCETDLGRAHWDDAREAVRALNTIAKRWAEIEGSEDEARAWAGE